MVAVSLLVLSLFWALPDVYDAVQPAVHVVGLTALLYSLRVCVCACVCVCARVCVPAFVRVRAGGRACVRACVHT